MELSEIETHVREVVAECGELPLETVTADTALIGPTAVIKSRVLVEVLLELEEYAEDVLDKEFDWTSDSAMSQSKSIFRTVGSLAKHLSDL